MSSASRGALLALCLFLGLLLATSLGYQTSDGAPLDETATDATAMDATATDATITIRDGEEVFVDACSACHGRQGGGRIGPALDGNRNLARHDYVTAIILRGRDGMPPFHDKLSEEEVVRVSEYVRGAWGNEFAAQDALDEVDSGDDSLGNGSLGNDSFGDDELDAAASAAERLTAEWWRGAEDAEHLYRRVCARCHGEEGGGGFGPALVQNENLSDPQYVAGKILHGQGGMPAFESLLRTERIAVLASYIRSSFGNSFGQVAVEAVRALQTRPPQESPGRLRAVVFPSDARLSILGPDRFVHFVSPGDASQVGLVELSGLRPGSYTVTAGKEGYRNAIASVEILPLQESRLTLNLQSSSVAPVEGSEDSSGDARTTVQTGVLTTPLQASTTPVPINAQEYRRSCALCHGPEGQGGVGPPLAGNASLQDAQFLLDRVLNGVGPMPSFGNRLSDDQIAAIATHERVAWGNGFGEVTADQVASQRTTASPPEAPPADLASGQEMYEAYCAVCHGGIGYGGVGPALQGNPILRDTPYVISRIVMGGDGMPSFNRVLSTAEMAGLAAFIRTSWGNDYGPVAVFEAQNYHGGASSLTP